MAEVSDNVKAFRGAMEGLVAEHASSARAVQQRWHDTATAADKSAGEQVQKARELVARVRERSQDLRRQEEQDDRGEIDCVEEREPDEVDPEVERFSQQLNDARRARERAESAPAAAGQESAPSRTPPPGTPPSGMTSSSVPAAPPAPSAPTPAAWPRPGRSRPAEVDQPGSPGAAAPPAAPAPGWEAKAGRFGRGDQQRSTARPERPAARESDVDEPAEGAGGRPDSRWQVRAGRFGRGEQRSSSEQRARPNRPAANRRPADQDDGDEDDFSSGSWLR